MKGKRSPQNVKDKTGHKLERVLFMRVDEATWKRVNEAVDRRSIERGRCRSADALRELLCIGLDRDETGK